MANTSVFIPVITPVVTGAGLSGVGTVGDPLINTVTTTIGDTQVAYATSANTIGGDAGLTFNSASNVLTVTGGVVSTGFAPVHQASVPLNNGQIIALPSTAVTLAASPGANKVIIPISAQFVFHIVDPYAADAGSSWQLIWQGGSYIAPLIPSEAIVESAAGTYVGFIPTGGWLVVNPGNEFGTKTVANDGAIIPVTSAADKALQIKDDYNGVTNYTLGNAANTLTISVGYLVLDASTGLFE